MALALRVALQHALEIAEIFRDAVGYEIVGAAASFGLLFLVIEARRDRVMRVVRFVDGIGYGQLYLMCPQPSGLLARCQAMAAPEVEENVRGLRDQDVAVLEEGRGKRRMV